MSISDMGPILLIFRFTSTVNGGPRKHAIKKTITISELHDIKMLLLKKEM